MEGLADKEVMENLGFEGDIILSAEKTIEDLVQKLERSKNNSVVVLTDFDEHGKEQAKEITHRLDKKMDVHRTAREKFGRQLTSTDRRAIEDVKPLFEDKNKKFVDATLDRLFPTVSDKKD